ncbi:hypothetical protein [uncultured Tessaracoccus sp.]|uniref:hypothetical protein n=1 Tax=uncultured Tessaracoccus sp. TaxID=905023 RepID=UPI002620FBF8|nr:hypothetical protein [uncultured Tessaracoccus sp.]
MLKRTLVIAFCALCMMAPSTVWADTSATCRRSLWTCSVEADGGHKLPGDPTKTDDKPAPGKKPGKPRQCHIGNQPIPCTNTFGTWISTRQMWCKPKQPQPPNTDPIWKNNTEGKIYLCTRPEHTNIADPAMQTTTWLPNTNPTPPPNPEQLAWKALATIHLQPTTPQPPNKPSKSANSKYSTPTPGTRDEKT